MKIFYLRVSTDGQNLERQKKLAKDECAEKIFEEKISGKDANRPELQKMLDYCREGDVVCVESISRLARSTRDLLNIIDKLTKKDVGFISYKENIDTTTPQGRFILTIFGALAELEREQTLQRQREGIEIAKAAGKYKGKQKKKFDEKKMDELYPIWKKGDITARIFMNRLNLKPNTFYRRIKDYEKERGIV